MNFNTIFRTIILSTLTFGFLFSPIATTQISAQSWLKLTPADASDINRISKVLFPQNGPNFNFSNNSKFQVEPTSFVKVPQYDLSVIGTNEQSTPTKTSQIIQAQSQTVSSNSNFNNTPDSTGFNPGLVVNEQTLYGLSDGFSSPSKIEQYLRSKGSFLADYEVDVSLESDDDLLSMKSNSLDTGNNFGKYQNTRMKFSEMVWKLSRTSMGNTCSTSTAGMCIDMQNNPINPAFVLAMINKESGLITGQARKGDPNDEETRFLINRATGYLCIESKDKSKTCYDQNPNWKYYKGMFRQTYYMIRSLLLYSKRCENKGVSIYGGQLFKVGNTIQVDDEKVKLENGITCALYIYTPHVFGQKPLFRSLVDMNALIGNYRSSTIPPKKTQEYSSPLQMIRI